MMKLKYNLTTAVVIGLACSAVYAGESEIKHVNCSAGESLSKEINKAKPGTVVDVSGTCLETIIITTDNIHIKGFNATLSTDPGASSQDLVIVDGAKRVVLSDLTLTNGSNGILAKNGAHFSLQNTVVKDSANFGINLTGASFMTIENSRVINCGNNCINVMEGSNVNIVGDLTVSGAGTFGINFQDGANVSITNATVNATQNTFGIQLAIGVTATVTDSTVNASANTLLGMTVDSGSSLFSFNSHFIASDNQVLDGFGANTNSNIDLDKDSSIVTNNNGRDGLNIENTMLNLFVFFTPIGPRIEANNNKRHGIFLSLGAKLDLGSGTKLQSNGNVGAGLLVEDGSSANLIDTEIQNNGDGSINDVQLVFGSRVNFISGNTIGTLGCDTSSFAKGERLCQ